MITLQTVAFDDVIKSRYISAKTTYNFALEKLVPLISRLEIQRNIQDAKFYHRLEKDIIKGCIMPPLTLAFIDKNAVSMTDETEIKSYINNNIENGFILDGIQRLNTLKRASEWNNFNQDKVIFLNILICSSADNLLYRMITLNNGQKPMSARHQIEILTSNIFSFEDSNGLIVTERSSINQKRNVSIKKADFIKGYLAFLANSTNIENQKIIEERLDSLIADKILESDITENSFEFSEVISLVDRFSRNKKEILIWFQNVNNLIGFCVGIKKQFVYFKNLEPEVFMLGLSSFENTFKSFNVSKIKVGQERRKMVDYFIGNFPNLHEKNDNALLDELSQLN